MASYALTTDGSIIPLRINKRPAKGAIKKDSLFSGPPLIPVCQLPAGQCTVNALDTRPNTEGRYLRFADIFIYRERMAILYFVF